MLLKNLMEDKQLDFNRPLLSVRRFSSPVATSEAEVNRKTDNKIPKLPPLPSYKSELKSGPIRNPGTVPFQWEQTPGRPKDESRSRTRALERPPIAPKLPPGRMLNVKNHVLDKVSEGTNNKGSKTANVLTSSQSFSSSDKNSTKHERSIEGIEDTESSSTEDGDEAYVDALDTLSRSESFFLNCSVSGVSGLDDAEVKPSGIFSADPQARDFMMGRFLPAAKAMASEVPQHTSRKQPVVQEQPGHFQKIVSMDKQHPPKQYSSSNLHFHAQHKRWEESDDEDDYDGHENSSSTVCGLIPRLCLKSSFCLLNPVPGMRLQDREPVALDHRALARSSYPSSCSGPENENVRDAVHGQSSTVGCQTGGMQENKLWLKREANQVICGSKCHELVGSSPNRHLQGNVVSPNKNENCHSVSNNEDIFLEIPENAKNFEVNSYYTHRKGSKNLRELMASESTKWESDLKGHVEKTLYIDSVHKVKSPTPSSSSSSSDTKRLSDGQAEDFNVLVKSKEMEETASIESSIWDNKHLNVADEKVMLQLKALEAIDSENLSSPGRSCQGVKIDIKKSSREDQALTKDLITLASTTVAVASTKVAGTGKIDLESQLHMKLSNKRSSRRLIQDSISSTRSKMGADGKVNLESQTQMALSGQEGTLGNHLQFPLPPPKSPSDSWLKRTLPTVSTRNSSICSSLGKHNYTRIQGSKSPSVDSKWETIVKASNVQHGHLRFSEELLTPIPET